MLLKKFYKKDTDPPELDYLSLAHTGTQAAQNFSIKQITEWLGAGVAEIEGDQLTIHTHPEDLRYTIERGPGRYCLHCDEKLQDDERGQLARLHIQQKHQGHQSPDPNVPAGYIALNHFACVLDPAQHEKWRVKDPARAPHFPLKGES